LWAIFFFFFCLVGGSKKDPTMDNLRKQYVIVVNRCCMCKRDEESVGHLLLYYEVACDLNELLTCLLVGGLLVALGVCGRWCPLVFCGVFGGK
jgi:hypothetical protein